MSTSDGKIGYLDGWRGIAIILVLIGHFGPAVVGPIGKFGVTLFFVLSGFFMSKLLFIKGVSLDTFFARRFSRVMPALWLFITAMIGWSLYVQPTPYRPGGAEIMSTFAFLRAYFPADNSIWADNWPTSHLWSLNIEEHSYIFLAIVAVLFARAKSKIPTILFLAASIGAVTLVSLYYGKISEPSSASPWYVRSECASLGILASALYNVILHYYGGAWVKRLAVPAMLALIPAALIFTPLVPFGRTKTFAMVLAAPLLCAFAMNHVSAFPDLFKKVLSAKVLRWFGVYSFSIYLWQQPLQFYARQTTASPIICLLVALALGSLSFFCIENPLRIYFNRKWDTFKSRPTVVLATDIV